MQKELLLSEGMHKNYLALQRFLNNEPLQRRSPGGAYGKSLKRRQRKAYLLSLQDYKCIDCNIEFTQPDGNLSYPTATADHVIPYRFGSTLDYNVEFVCDKCNNKRELDRMPHILRYFGSI